MAREGAHWWLVAADGKHCSLFFFISILVVLARDPLTLLASAGQEPPGPRDLLASAGQGPQGHSG